MELEEMRKRQKIKLLRKYGFLNTKNCLPVTENHDRRIDKLLGRKTEDRPMLGTLFGKGCIMEAKI